MGGEIKIWGKGDLNQADSQIPTGAKALTMNL